MASRLLSVRAILEKSLMEPTDITIELLREIRDEIRTTNGRIDGVRDEIRATKDALRATNDELRAMKDETNARFDTFARRQTETEIRLATEIIAVAGAVREVRDVLRDDLALRARVDDHERRIRAMEHRGG